MAPPGIIKKPEILFIHNTYLQKGGEDSVVQNEINTLRQNGYTIFYLEFNNSHFQRSGLRKLVVPFSIFFNISSFLKTYFFVKKHGIGVVHVHNFFYHASPSVFWAAKAAGAKTLFTLHNYRLFCLNGIFFRAGQVCYTCHTNRNFRMGIQEKCFKSSRPFSRALAWSTLFHRELGTWQNKIDRFVVINPFMKELLVSRGIRNDKIVLKQNVLTESEHKGITDNRERADFYLYAGRLSLEKGIHHLVEAFQQTGKKLLIAGDGELADYVRQNATRNIEYLGSLSGKEIFHLYATCQALVFPSLWIEGLPMTIIEAQSTGAVCIAAASVNTKGMIENGKTGFLYEAGNIADLNRVINIFEAINTEDRNRLSKDIYEQFLDRYSETQHIKAAGQLYHW